MANPGSYGAGTPTPTPVAPATAPAASPAPVTSGSFPQTPSGQGLGVNGISVANISVNSFLSNYDISSTEENTYLTQGSNGQPGLNQNALMLMQYQAMTPEERQDYQESLVNAGLLPASDANGVYNSASVSAFKNAISTAATQGSTVDQYLQQYSGTNNVNTALAAATGRAEQEAAAPTTATLENPTTLAAQITSAFDQTVGYAPSQDQINSFISQIQGQDVANAQAPHEAAQQQLALLKSDQSQLSKLGPDGITAVVNAYTNAIHGLNPAAGNTANQQGVPTGTAPVPGAPSANPSGLIAGPMGQTTEPVAPSLLQRLGHAASTFNPLNLQSGFFSNSNPLATPDSSRTVATGGAMMPAPAAPIGTPGTTPTYGGIYALTPADWTEIKKLYPQASKYATAGQAPPAIQQAAFTTLLQNVYDNNGNSWADAITTIAKGAVGSGANKATGMSSTNLETFATGIANNVEQQLTSLANEVNTQSVTEKTTAPDATAEANLAAKSADPVGYYAANAATAGSLLNQMLAGAPQMYGESTADTFTGPVSSAAVESGGSAPAPALTAA